MIDVGANIGFFTVRFAAWVGSGGCVIAIEPEAENLGALRQRIEKHGIENRVRIVPAVVINTRGTAHLKVNPDHPGDHSVAETGVEVAAVTIDDLVRDENVRTLSLIKIDVQGAEMLVLEGARETLTKMRPTLLIEVGDAQLRNFGPRPLS